MIQDVYERIGELVRKGECFVLCSVTGTTGSTPRKEGAVMAVLPDGTGIGSVGGGQVEYECLLKAEEMLKTQSGKKETVLHFDLYPGSPDSDHVCGGEMDISLTVADPDDTALRERILGLTEANKRRKVYIFGGGHVAQALVPVLAAVGFAPVVYEEREEFASKELFEEAEAVICGSFEHIGEYIGPKETDYIAIMTRGHEDDYTVLKQALSTNVEYIGLMGSRSKRAMLFGQLKKDGFEDKDLARVHNPIGLDIGSETPAEIAVSIAAELIAVRAGKRR